MKYKMFVADFDGTLGKAPDYVSQENIDAINEYVGKGGKFLVCTGRSFPSIKNILNAHDIHGEVICCQGALLGNVDTGEVILSYGMDKADLRDIVAYLHKNYPSEAVMAITSDGLCFDRENKYTAAYEELVGMKGTLYGDIVDASEKFGFDIYKLMTICDLEKSLKIIENFNNLKTKYLANSGYSGLVEIINPECDKGATLKRYVDDLNISSEEVITVGDSSNDISLMQFGFYGVAVGDGNGELKANAKEVTLPFKENPVAYLLKKYCL